MYIYLYLKKELIEVYYYLLDNDRLISYFKINNNKSAVTHYR